MRDTPLTQPPNNVCLIGTNNNRGKTKQALTCEPMCLKVDVAFTYPFGCIDLRFLNNNAGNSMRNIDILVGTNNDS